MGLSDAIGGFAGVVILVKQMPVYLCVVMGWVFLLMFFCWHAVTHPMPVGKRVDLASLIGAGLQLFAFWGLWVDHRRVGLPEGWLREARVAAGLAGMVFVGACVYWIIKSTRTLGENWSLEARVGGKARLVTRGPYRVVRHPIYVGFLLLLCMTLLIVGQPGTAWVFLAAYLVGMAIRVRREDSLLAQAFGRRYQAYRAKVPGVVWGSQKGTRDKVKGIRQREEELAQPVAAEL
jgi:protein-S-isoprenylcysteine O-methyltransferase Ste14